MRLWMLLFSLIFYLSTFSQNKAWKVDSPFTNDGIHDIEVINDSIAYIYTYGTGKVYKTITGGNKWQLISELDSAYYEQMQFIEANTGWICGERGLVYKTIDGGKSWLNKSIRCINGNLLLYSLYFNEIETGYAAGAILKDRKLKPVIYKTTSGGDNWSLIDTSFSSMILNMSKIRKQLIVCGNSFILEYIDSIKTYNSLFKDSLNKIGQIRSFHLTEEGNGFAASFNGYILITSDGGKNWKETNITKNRLRDIQAIGTKIVLAAGDKNIEDGSLYLSTDNGISWSIQDFDFPDIHRIGISESFVWLVGKNGFVAKKEIKSFN